MYWDWGVARTRLSTFARIKCCLHTAPQIIFKSITRFSPFKENYQVTGDNSAYHLWNPVSHLWVDWLNWTFCKVVCGFIFPLYQMVFWKEIDLSHLLYLGKYDSINKIIRQICKLLGTMYVPSGFYDSYLRIHITYTLY